MLGHFPTPRPDELLYSICARYSELMRFPNNNTAAYRLFGKRTSVAVDMPSGIDHLIHEMPEGCGYTAEIVIKDQTLEPLFAPFLPADRLSSVTEDLRGFGSNHVYSRLGINARELKRPKWLRFCPSCVRDDRRQYSEAYWHRIHQIQGVEVCPYHEIFLETSTAPWFDRSHPGKVIAAENVVAEAPERALDLADPKTTILLKIAREFSWLLTWRGQPLGDVLRERYCNLLLRRGLAHYNGRVKTTEFLKSFIEFFSPELLDKLQCPIGNQRISWPLRLLYLSKSAQVSPPLHHVLLVIFLDVTLEQLFTQFDEYKPFGDSPWPCLNPVADHFQQLLVTVDDVKDIPIKRKPGQPRRIFRCGCGFIYSRTGPDASEDDRTRYDSVVSYGPVWEEAFRRHWQDDALTLERMAKNFGVIQFTLKRHAIRLGLPLLRQSRGSRLTSEKIVEKYSKTRETLDLAKETYRQKWLSICEANPTAGRRQLQSLNYYTYWWLKRNDSKWLEEHLPSSRTPLPPPQRVNWEKADEEISPEIVKSVNRIKNLPGRPVRASLAEIIRDIGRRAWIENYLHLLPMTAQAISDHAELLEDFMLRKVAWATNHFLQEGRVPPRHQFEKMAGVRNKTGQSAKVQSAVDSAMELLIKGSSHS